MTEKYNMPDERGHFGPYGGIFVAETLIPPVQELNAAYQRYMHDPEFIAEMDADLQHYVGRPSPLYHAERWSNELGGASSTILVLLVFVMVISQSGWWVFRSSSPDFLGVQVIKY